MTHEYEVIDALKAAAAAGIEASIELSLETVATGHKRGNGYYKPVIVTYATVGAGYDDQVCYSREYFDYLGMAVTFLMDLSTQIKERPLPGIEQWQTLEKLDFAGINSYLGRWEFPNGWGLSLCRSNTATRGGVDFNALLFYGYKGEDDPDYVHTHKHNGDCTAKEALDIAWKIISFDRTPKKSQLQSGSPYWIVS